MDIFMTAIRKKYRFDSTSGFLSVEDLWDLPLTATANRVCLDTIAKNINRQIKNSEEESFVENTSTALAVELRTKLEILKYIIATKQAEKAEADKAKERAANRFKLLEIIERKENNKLEEMDVEDLKKMLEG